MAWPICRKPVILGGGITMAYGGLGEDSSTWLEPAASQTLAQCSSIPRGSYPAFFTRDISGSVMHSTPQRESVHGENCDIPTVRSEPVEGNGRHKIIESDINKKSTRQATGALGRYPTTVYRRMSGSVTASSDNLERACLKCADCKCASRSASLRHSSTNVKSVELAVFWSNSYVTHPCSLRVGSTRPLN